MLYYHVINEQDGVDYGEGRDVVRTSKDISRQCQSCNFYYFVTQNFTRNKYNCDGCFFCKVYEQDSKGLLIFRVVKTNKGMFRTVSSCFLKEVEEHLKVNDLNKEYGWLFW